MALCSSEEERDARLAASHASPMSREVDSSGVLAPVSVRGPEEAGSVTGRRSDAAAEGAGCAGRLVLWALSSAIPESLSCQPRPSESAAAVRMRAMVPRPSVVMLTARMRSAWRKEPSGEGVWLRAPSMRILSSLPPRDQPVAAMASQRAPTTSPKAMSPLVRTGRPPTCQMTVVRPPTRSEPMTRSMTPATMRARTGAGGRRRCAEEGVCATGRAASGSEPREPSPCGSSGALSAVPYGLTTSVCGAPSDTGEDVGGPAAVEALLRASAVIVMTATSWGDVTACRRDGRGSAGTNGPIPAPGASVPPPCSGRSHLRIPTAPLERTMAAPRS